MNLEDQLRHALHHDSEQLVVVGAGTDTVRRRAHRRRNRSRIGIAAVAAAGVAGSAVAVAQLRPEENDSVAVQPVAPKTMPNFAWRTVKGTVSTYGGQIATAGGVTYVLSTAPGSADSSDPDPDKSLYRSDDGEHWTSQPLGANKWMSSLSERDGVLYGVGTAPGTSDVIGVQLTTSNNDGASWSPPTKLPYEFAKPAATIELSQSAFVSGARGANATVVIASAAFQPNLSAVLGATSYRPTANGVEVLDLSKCDKMAVERGVQASGESDPAKRLVTKDCTEPPVLETKPWSDFGISDPAALHQSRVLVSTDGRTWKDSPSPLPAGSWGAQVHATTQGFLLSGTTDPALTNTQVTHLFASPDGEHWTELPSLPTNYQLLSAWGDTLVAGDYGQIATVMVSTDGGASWSSSSPGVVDPNGSYSFPSAGPLGVALVYSMMSPGTRTDVLMFSPDGRTWKHIDLGDVGAPERGTINNVRVGADHVEVVYALNEAPGQKPDTLLTLLATPTAP